MGGPSQEPNFDPREMAYSANVPILSYKDQSQPASHSQSYAHTDMDNNRQSTSPNVPFSAQRSWAWERARIHLNSLEFSCLPLTWIEECVSRLR